jgi:hypothetical protein
MLELILCLFFALLGGYGWGFLIGAKWALKKLRQILIANGPIILVSETGEITTAASALQEMEKTGEG